MMENDKKTDMPDIKREDTLGARIYAFRVNGGLTNAEYITHDVVHVLTRLNVTLGDEEDSLAFQSGFWGGSLNNIRDCYSEGKGIVRGYGVSIEEPEYRSYLSSVMNNVAALKDQAQAEPVFWEELEAFYHLGQKTADRFQDMYGIRPSELDTAEDILCFSADGLECSEEVQAIKDRYRSDLNKAIEEKTYAALVKPPECGGA